MMNLSLLEKYGIKIPRGGLLLANRRSIDRIGSHSYMTVKYGHFIKTLDICRTRSLLYHIAAGIRQHAVYKQRTFHPLRPPIKLGSPQGL